MHATLALVDQHVVCICVALGTIDVPERPGREIPCCSLGSLQFRTQCHGPVSNLAEYNAKPMKTSNILTTRIGDIGIMSRRDIKPICKQRKQVLQN